MTRPGVDTTTIDTAPPFVTNTDTGQAFVAASTARGPTSPQLLQSIADYVRLFGPRLSTSMGYDWIETAFKCGAGRIYLSRIVGPAATAASKVITNSGTMFTVTANGVGTWGNGVSVSIVADGGGLFHMLVTFTDSDGTVYSEQSPATADPAQIAAWGDQAQFVRVAVGSAAMIAVAPASLLTGSDDIASENDTALGVALARFVRELGPGQVCIPGRVTVTAIQAAADHAATFDRVVLADGPDTASASTLTALAVTVRALANARLVQLLAPWIYVPGLIGGTTRRVPYSALQAGLVSLNDQANPASFAVAGPARGRSSYPLDVTQTYIDSDRVLLSNAGVTVGRMRSGAVTTYDYVSAVNPLSRPEWVNFGTARLVMWCKANGRKVADGYLFSPIDGKGVLISAFASALEALLKPLQDAGSIYGSDANRGYRIDTSGNTIVTIANNELHATMLVRTSPFAQWIAVNIVNVAISQTGV